jgi:predicted acetyltransferase
MSLEIRPMRSDDREGVHRVSHQAFNVPKSQRGKHELPLEQVRVAEEDGRVVGTTRVYDFGHWFGGRSVQTAGIAMVAVSPEARGHKVAEALMTETLREQRAAGTPFSSLYPATVSLYRRVGYEYAAPRTEWEVNLRSLPKGGVLEPEVWTDDDLDEIIACRTAWASANNGQLDRPRWWWEDRITTPDWDDLDVYRLCVREGGEVTGYMIYTQGKPKRGDWGYEIGCRDFVWRTPEAARSLTTVAARHRSLAHHLQFYGAPVDPLAFLVNEQDVKLVERFNMMGRLVDLPAAIEARGYGPHVEASVEVTVTDSVLGENTGTWSISVAEGRAKVAPSNGTRASTDIATLSAIWTGILSPHDAVRTGRLEASAGDVAALEAIFGGRAPWVADWF